MLCSTISPSLCASRPPATETSQAVAAAPHTKIAHVLTLRLWRRRRHPSSCNTAPTPFHWRHLRHPSSSSSTAPTSALPRWRRRHLGSSTAPTSALPQWRRQHLGSSTAPTLLPWRFEPMPKAPRRRCLRLRCRCRHRCRLRHRRGAARCRRAR